MKSNEWASMREGEKIEGSGNRKEMVINECEENGRNREMKQNGEKRQRERTNSQAGKRKGMKKREGKKEKRSQRPEKLVASVDDGEKSPPGLLGRESPDRESIGWKKRKKQKDQD